MADVSTYLAKIMSAVYGEEVRGSIHDAISAMNDESSEAIECASTAKDSASSSATKAASAQSAAETAQAAAESSASSASSSAIKAASAQSAAETAQAAAESSASSASSSAESVADALEFLEICQSAVNHRRMFRGKSLGTSVTSAQLSAIQANTFDDLWLGDYWTINSVNWRIWDFNYWYKAGDTSFTSPHLIIIPDKCLYNAQMNTSNITTGGYVGSVMYTTNLETAKTTISSAFGDAVLTHREYLTNAVSNGYPSGGAWCNSTVELPNEIMMYGSLIYSPAGNGSTIVNRYTISKKQLALAAIMPEYVNIQTIYWLRDVVSSANFAFVGSLGTANYGSASVSLGVRPVFAIG